MPFTLTVEEASKIVWLTLSGASDFGEVLDAFKKVGDVAQLRPELDVLIDARPCEYIANSTDLARFIQSPAWALICRAHSVAILVTKQIHYGNANIMARTTTSRNDSLNVEPFYDLEKAKEWFRSRRNEQPEPTTGRALNV